jgi:steroid 5-alpha reductase family enzyme
MIPGHHLLPAAALCSLLMLVLWLRQQRTKDASLVDLGWTAGLGALGVLHAVRGDGDPARRVVLGAIAGLWALRLGWHLWTDRIRGKEEDGRYQELRAGWGTAASRNFFLFFQAQAVLDVVLSIPFLVVAANGATAPGWREGLAVAIAAVAVGGETVADRQLAAFRADPAHRGITCRQGLWRYSRHPNYFFEWLHWWAYVPLAIPDLSDGASAAATAWPVLLGPALMLVFVLKITGIPPTEARALRSRGDDYRRYQTETNAFFPWFPRAATHPRTSPETRA